MNRRNLKAGDRVRLFFHHSSITLDGVVYGIGEKNVGVDLDNGDTWTGLLDGPGGVKDSVDIVRL